MTSLPWLRLYTELLSDRKIKLISADTGLPKPLIIGVWVSLLMLAGESPERGRIISARGKAWPFAFIADEIGLDEPTCQRIIDEFIGMNMIFQDDEGAYVVVKWEERQFKSDDSYSRVKKFRAEKRGKVEAPDLKGGIENDEYTKRFNSDTGNVSETFLETPQSQIQIQNQNITSKEVGDKSPDPKKQLMGIFLEETGLKMPHRKSDIGFWWSAINEIYGLVDNNIGLGGNTIRQVVRQMRNDKLTISNPNSIVNLCRALCANAPPGRNGHKLDPEKDAIYQELMQKQKGL